MTIKEAEELISRLKSNHYKLNPIQQSMFAKEFGPIEDIPLNKTQYANYTCIRWLQANVMSVSSSIVKWPKIVKH